jgi:hypothetical protein
MFSSTWLFSSKTDVSHHHVQQKDHKEHLTGGQVWVPRYLADTYWKSHVLPTPSYQLRKQLCKTLSTGNHSMTFLDLLFAYTYLGI